MPMPAKTGRTVLPFRYNTRQRFQFVQHVNLTAGGQASVELPRVGFLAGILIQFNGGINRSPGDSGAFTERMFNLLNRIGVNMNIGATSIVDISGYGLRVQNQTSKTGWSPDNGGSVATGLAGTVPEPGNPGLAMDSSVFFGHATVPEASEPLILTWWIPIAANEGRNFNMGLINLQAPEVRCTVDLRFGTLADLFAPGAVLTGTSFTAACGFDIHYLYYEVPNPQRVALPPLMLHRLLEERTPFSNTGDIVYTVPRQGSILRLIHQVVLDAVNAANGNVREFKLRVNKTDDIYRFVLDGPNRFWQTFNYGSVLPQGAFVHEFWSAEEVPASGDMRDVVDSEAISTLESIVTIAPGAILGVGNNFLDTTREIVQVLQA